VHRGWQRVNNYRYTHCTEADSVRIPYILESNPHHFYSFRGLKNQMRNRIACGLHSRSWAGFWKNDRAAVRAVRTIKYNNLLLKIYNILYDIYNLLFIKLAVITHNWIAIRHPVTIISCGAFVPLAVKWPLHTRRVSRITVKALVEWKRIVMAHAQKPDLVFQRNGRVHLYRRGCQFSRLLAVEVCASAVVMLDRTCYVTVPDCWLPTPFASFPFTSPPMRHRVQSDSVSTLTSNIIQSVCLVGKGRLKEKLRIGTAN